MEFTKTAIKDTLKRFTLLNRLNVRVKAPMQERHTFWSLAHYRAGATRSRLRVLDGHELVAQHFINILLRGEYDFPFEYDVSFVGGKDGWGSKFISRLRMLFVKKPTKSQISGVVEDHQIFEDRKEKGLRI